MDGRHRWYPRDDRSLPACCLSEEEGYRSSLGLRLAVCMAQGMSWVVSVEGGGHLTRGLRRYGLVLVAVLARDLGGLLSKAVESVKRSLVPSTSLELVEDLFRVSKAQRCSVGVEKAIRGLDGVSGLLNGLSSLPKAFQAFWEVFRVLPGGLLQACQEVSC